MQQLDGASEMTVADWVAEKQSGNAPSQKRPGRKKTDTVNLDEVLAKLEQQDTHAALDEAIIRLSLSASDWKALAKKLTGRTGNSGKQAREAVQTRLSDRLLLDERVESVKRQLNIATPPPAAS